MELVWALLSSEIPGLCFNDHVFLWGAVPEDLIYLALCLNFEIGVHNEASLLEK
jgi:hypothetical protein